MLAYLVCWLPVENNVAYLGNAKNQNISLEVGLMKESDQKLSASS